MASVNIIQPCSDSSDITPLYPLHGLYLKPIAKLNISVHLPTLKLPGKAISNWEVIEKLKYWTIPDEFTSIVVSKSTLEFIRFDAEIESRSKLAAVLARLDGRFIKISGFTESLKVRAAEAKCDFPTRHNWDSFFRDAKHMNEMKPGERPDTIHIKNLPCKWFSNKPNIDKPSEYILKKVFETFGEVRFVDIPSLDPYRGRMKAHISGIKMFTYHQNIVFESYIQFKEYVCFVKAMDTLRGMKLIHKEDSKMFSASVVVDFDKTKHLSDTLIRKRRTEREKLMMEDRMKDEEERLKKEKEEAAVNAERNRKLQEKEDKLKRRKMREEKRKLKQLEKLKAKEAEEMNRKIASEERLLLMAQRRLESIRLLSELLKRVEESTLKKLAEKKELEKWSKKDKNRKGKEAGKHYSDLSSFTKKEEELRNKLIKKLKSTDTKRNRDEDSLPGSSKTSDAVALTGVSGAVPVSSSSHEEVTSLITSSESDMSLKDNDSIKSSKGKKTEPLPDKYHANRRWYPHQDGSSYQYHGMNNSGFSRHPNRGYFPRGRRGFRWPYYRGRGGFFPPPYIDPMLLDINHQYYKYFQKLAHGRESRSPIGRSRSYSRSRSRSSSRSSYYSRRYSRSRTYSRSRSRSRTRKRTDRSRSSTRSRSRSRRKSKNSRTSSSRRSRSASRARHHSRSRSSSRSKRYNRSKKTKHSRNRTKSRSRSRSDTDKQTKRKSRWDTVESENPANNSTVDKSVKDINQVEQQPKSDTLEDTTVVHRDGCDNDNDNQKRSPIRFPSPRTWSRSPSQVRSVSGDKKKDNIKDSSVKKGINESMDKNKDGKEKKKHKKNKKHKSK